MFFAILYCSYPFLVGDESGIDAKGYYDRVNEAIIDIFKNENFSKRETELDYSRKHKVWPFNR